MNKLNIFILGLIGLGILVAGDCIAGQLTEQERICNLEDLHGIQDSSCIPPPPIEECGNGIIEGSEQCEPGVLDGQTCITQGFDGGTLTCSTSCTFDTSGCETNPPPPTGGSLANGVWKTILGSEMRSIYDPVIDKQWDSVNVGAPLSFENIQQAWSGGSTCIVDTIYVLGGGHGDGAHSGVFSVNVKTGKWDRVTMPSPIWQAYDPTAPYYCPAGLCDPPFGATCKPGVTDCTSNIQDLNVLPDGSMTARHTYDLITSDGEFLYVLGGANWSSGNGGNQPRSWKLNLSTKVWSPLADSNWVKSTGVSEIVNGKIYHAVTSWGGSIYDTDLDSWLANGYRQKPMSVAAGGLVYAASVNRLFAFGGGTSWSIALSDWPTGPMNNIPAEGKALSSHVGIIPYPPEDLLLLWDGGASLGVLHVQTETWGESLVLSGDAPGDRVGSGGPFGRFSYCGNRPVVINGPDNPIYYIDVGQ